MKKILLMSLLCLTIVACGKKEEAKQETAETTNVTQEQDYGVPNPYEIVDTLIYLFQQLMEIIKNK